MVERSRPRIRPKPKRERVREGESKRKLLLALVGARSHPIPLRDFVARCTICIDGDIILMDASASSWISSEPDLDIGRFYHDVISM